MEDEDSDTDNRFEVNNSVLLRGEYSVSQSNSINLLIDFMENDESSISTRQFSGYL